MKEECGRALVDHARGLTIGNGLAQGTMLGPLANRRRVSAMEKMLTGRAFVCGKTFTAADVYVGSTIDWGLAFKSIPSCPAFETYAERVRARPAYTSAKAINGTLIPATHKT